MSNHFTGLSLGPPLGDQRLDLCDLYAFQSPADPARTVIILNANPNADALHPDAIYRLNIDNDGDCLTDIAFSYVFSKPQERQADRQRLHGEGRGVALGRSGRDEDHRRRRGLLRRQAQHRQGRRLHVLRRQPQRRFLLRLRRNQEPVRHQGRAELHRAPPRRQVSVDRRGFEYRSQRVLDGGRAADERTRRQARDPHLGAMQRAAGRQAAPRRSRRPSERQQLLQHRRHQGGIQRQRAGERSQALARSVRPSDGAYRQLHARRSDCRDRHGAACCPTC